jgi:hypothetical protein
MSRIRIETTFLAAAKNADREEEQVNYGSEYSADGQN